MKAVEEWSPADGLVLEPNALDAAVDRVDNVLVFAGPGAGKTELLAQRVDFLLRSQVARYPSRILAIAFKVDASVNLAARVRARSGIELARRLDSCTFHAFARRLVESYRLALPSDRRPVSGFQVGARSNWPSRVAYDDLIPLATRIVNENAFARHAIRSTYGHVLLDEFQDCTSIQYSFLTASFMGTACRLTAVGDGKQRIMGWAGALEGVFQRYETDFSARRAQLYQNRRSMPRVRRFQNAMVKRMDEMAAVADEEVSGDGGLVRVMISPTCTEEAVAVADLIEEARSDGIPLSEVAVLFSKQSHLYGQALIDELDKRSIPHRDEQAIQDLLVEPVFELVCDYLRVLIGDREPAAYTRLLSRLIGTESDEEGYRLNLFWSEFIANERQEMARLKTDWEMLGPARGQRAREMSTSFLDVAAPEVLQGLSVQYEEQAALADVQERVCNHVDEVFASSLSPSRALSRLVDEDSVRILSIHKSKGMEFDTVIVMAVEEETFWSDATSERSAFFVAVSRARRQLVLTATRFRRRPSGSTGRWDSERTPHVEFLGYADA